MKKYLNKKGYTLTYAIVVIGLLLIVTGSVTFISYYNLKTARIGGQVNTSFYANDGAMEEALTELNQYVYNAEVKAWDHINEHNFIVNDSDWVDFLERIYQDVNNGVEGFSIEKGNELIAAALKGEFESMFFSELLNKPVTHQFFVASKDDLKDRYLDFDGYTGVVIDSTSTLKPDMITKFKSTTFTADNIVSPDTAISVDAFNFDLITVNSDGSFFVDTENPNNDGFTISFRTDGTYHDYQKKLEVNTHVVAPDYEFSVAMLTENFEMYKNKLTSYGLVSNDNIVVMDGDVTVHGDIYAYGNYKDEIGNLGHIDVMYNLPRDNYGGIVVGYKDTSDEIYTSDVIDNEFTYSGDVSGTLTVNGMASTRNSVKLETSASSLNVSKDINANNLYVRDNTDSVNVNVADDIMLYSDIFIAGKNTTIKVGNSSPSIIDGTSRKTFRYSNGEIWGLHHDNPASGDAYTRLGSIIISSKAENPLIEANGVFLNGVIRYDVEGHEVRNPAVDADMTSYRTGESFTTYNNAQYYQTLMSDNIYQNGVFAFLSSFANSSGVNFDMISFDALAGVNQVAYRSNHYFTMGYMANNPSAFGLDDNYYKKVSDADKSILQLRDPNPDANGQFYGVHSPGIIAFKDIDENTSKVYNISKTQVDFDSTKFDEILSDDTSNDSDEAVDKEINLLGYRFEDGDVYREENLFDKWLDFNVGTEASPVARPSVPLKSMTATSFGIYNNDPSKDVYVNFPSSFYNGDGSPKDPDHIYIKGVSDSIENLEGVIVSKGDIYIYADAREVLNLNGSVISEKSIYLLGSGDKVITSNNQDEMIYGIIHKADGDENDSADDGLPGLFMTEYGRRMAVPSGAVSVRPGFGATIENNTDLDNKVTINYVSQAKQNGTNIIESNAIIIDSWREID